MKRFTEESTKTELRKAARWISAAAALFMIAPAAMANSTDGAIVGHASEMAQASAVAQSGRAVLTIEDLKTLLGLSARDPSAVGAVRSHQDEATTAYNFTLMLSTKERQQLVSRIHQTETERAKLSASLDKRVATEKADLRTERRALQNKRMGAKGAKEEQLAAALFDSFMKEANSEARAARELDAFDNAHVISLSFNEKSGMRVVQEIAMGSSSVWSFGAGEREIAQK